MAQEENVRILAREVRDLAADLDARVDQLMVLRRRQLAAARSRRHGRSER